MQRTTIKMNNKKRSCKGKRKRKKRPKRRRKERIRKTLKISSNHILRQKLTIPRARKDTQTLRIKIKMKTSIVMET